MLRHWTADERNVWDTFVANSQDGGLLQSWAWGAFQEKLGNAVYNVSNEEKTLFAQCLQLRAANQWVLVIPRGPVSLSNSTPDQLKTFFTDLRVFAKERGCFLVRFDPPWSAMPANVLRLMHKSRRERQPVHTLILDTTPEVDTIFASMKSKWRYNVRLAEKKSVTVRRGTSASDAATFFSLVAKTTDRQDFASYDEAYFATLIESLAASNQAEFFVAELQGKPIAALLVTHFGKVAIYLHGASDYEHRALMAPHLLQWEAIKAAKARGMSYDFWGVAAEPPANEQEKHWGGVTRFKKGFAPTTALTEYVGTYEMPVKPLFYKLYRLRQMMKH